MADRSLLRLTEPGPDDAEAFLEAVARSHELHAGWVSPPRTPADYQAFLDAIGDRLQRYLIRLTDGGEPVMLVTASEIVRGAFRSCYLGYYAFEPHTGRGLATAALGMVLEHLFDVVDLHRVEANIRPGNTRSIALVRRLGFTREGYSRDYLFLDGAWRDHERWALLATDPRPWHAPPSI